MSLRRSVVPHLLPPLEENYNPDIDPEAHLENALIDAEAVKSGLKDCGRYLREELKFSRLDVNAIVTFRYSDKGGSSHGLRSSSRSNSPRNSPRNSWIGPVRIIGQ